MDSNFRNESRIIRLNLTFYVFRKHGKSLALTLSFHDMYVYAKIDLMVGVLFLSNQGFSIKFVSVRYLLVSSWDQDVRAPLCRPYHRHC